MTNSTKIAPMLLALTLVAGCGGGLAPSNRSSRREPSIGGSSSSYGTSSRQQSATQRSSSSASRSSRPPAAQVTVDQTDYNGWSALRMSNGLVTVVAVPAIGGRIMEYKLGAHPFLWVNPDELGKTYEPPQSEADRQWHNFGGYKVWPAPQTQWGGPPDPLGSVLDGGAWTGKVITAGGQTGEIELLSPEDAVTGLQITRRVQMFSGTTRVLVTEVFKNVSDEPITWSIRTVTQVPGSLSAEEKFSEEARVYFPLNPDSRDPSGFWNLIANRDGSEKQFEVLDDGKLMQVSYHHKQGKIGADAAAGWIAYVDDVHQYAFVQRFVVSALDDYLDDGSTVEVLTSGADPYMELAALGPLHELQPGDQFSFAQDWYATRLGGPIRATTEVAAFREPLRLAEDAEGKLRLSGEFGVFLPGTVEVSLTDDSGRRVAEVTDLPAGPEQAVVLDQTVEPAPGATTVALRLFNDRGTLLGAIASIPLATQIGQVP